MDQPERNAERRTERTMRGRRAAAQIAAVLRRIERCRRTLARSGAASAAAEWLLDNAYRARQAGDAARSAFRRGERLRLAADGVPAVLAAARAALCAVPELAPDRLEAFLLEQESALPLSEQELSLLVSALVWALLERLDGLCQDPQKLLEGRTDSETADGMRCVFTAMRTLGDTDWGGFLEHVSPVERLMRADPAGDYGNMDEESRAAYRVQVCRLAKRTGRTQTDTARLALELARQGQGARRHVGWYLFREPLGQPEDVLDWRIYCFGILLAAAAASAAAFVVSGRLSAALLTLLPALEIAKQCADRLCVRLVRPRPVPRMALENGVPPASRTLCVIACLLDRQESEEELAARLERFRLANRDCGPELKFGLLADLPDSPVPAGERQRACVEAARAAIRALNDRYGGGFFLLFRDPIYCARDERYMGWERKRGALVELVRLLKGRRTALNTLEGDTEELTGVRYVITLDSDTDLCVGAARVMIGAMEHPLNRPEIDRERRVVTRGHGLLQPRIAVGLESANRTLFARIVAGQGGIDPYGGTASDVYHDLFDQGTYTGKGIFSVDAFYTCLERRLPDNAVLSHDLLEGSYLRAGALSGVELTDAFPGKVSAYFARLHRWVRGDWQLLPWILPAAPAGDGGWEDNPLPPLARWKMADNLRRSLTPAALLACLALGAFLPEKGYSAPTAAALLALAMEPVLWAASGLARHVRGHPRWHSRVIAGAAGPILRCALRALLLPYEAAVCVSAAATALWRMLIVHRDLLAWVTADQAQRRDGGPLAGASRLWPCTAAGLAFVVFARLPIARLLGAAWILAPLAAWRLSRTEPERPRLSEGERRFLLHQAALIWQYFQTYLRQEDHWLIPDNWQERPATGLARRTSPTNIAMSLLCVMAAADLDFISWAEAAGYLDHILAALEKLEKWHGHLYNWYDTASARPMEPRYISAVDSGNLCAGLVALAQGLDEWGEGSLARRARAVADGMELARLYDGERRLFHIGYDVRRGELSRSWYDLMASEARQTSYVAVARGEVSAKHWRRLGRPLLRDNDYSGMASWTGTMFEYLMPNLLLPCERSSMMYETLCFCLYAQKRWGARRRLPWGVSESAFYALDEEQNYQYKAHGVAALGLKRGLENDRVVAPYASFLALAVDPPGAVRNLRRLCRMGLEGQFGLCEAVDFTPGRAGAKGEPVRTYMAHHLGMSLAAVDNALNGEIMQRRFMGEHVMAAYRELLQERLCVDAPAMRTKPERDVPEKPGRSPVPAAPRRGEGAGRLAPERTVLSNGSYCVLVSDNGQSLSRLGSMTLTACRDGERFGPAGVIWLYRDEQDVFPLTFAPFYESRGVYGWQFAPGRCRWTAKHGALETVSEAEVFPDTDGERRSCALCWRGDGTRRGQLICYLEPVLFRERDYDAHPAFSRLFLHSQPLHAGVGFQRRVGPGQSAPALAVVWEGAPAAFTASRETLPGRGGLRALSTPGRLAPDGRTGGEPEPGLLVCFDVTLRPGRPLQVRLALAAAEGIGPAEDHARRLLRRAGHPESDKASPDAAVLRQEETCRLLRCLFAEKPPIGARREQSALWPWGVSGDVPVVLGDAAELGEEQALKWCRRPAALRRLGVRFDLVLLLDEGGDYRRPMYHALAEAVRLMGGVLGGKGGIHLLERTQGDVSALQSWAQVSLPLKEPAEERPLSPLLPWARKSGEVRPRWNADGSVTFALDGKLPDVGWGQVLCNKRFGWVFDETGGGFLWSGNAREGRLTPWRNESQGVGGWERLTVEHHSTAVSLFADGDGLSCTVTYGLGWARWEKRAGELHVVTTAFVPPDGETRVLLIELTGGGERIQLAQGEWRNYSWQVRPGAMAITTRPDGDGGVSSATDELTAEQAEQLLEVTKRYWQGKTVSLQVKTPEPALDHYLNGWALYQVIACRLFARTSLYQNGGAYGFRDQLQDVCALTDAAPELAREHILRCCARQYIEGDVQHWWHPPQGRGVRTRISDDLLWLPYAVERYVAATGELSLTEEQAPFLLSPPLPNDERERYELPEIAQETASVLEHGLRAIRCALGRGTGVHGLLLFGTGDWNDGMDRVGSRGIGESVWLTWFAAITLRRYADLCRRCGLEDTGDELSAQADGLTQAAQRAWDGSWYLRGYYDDGAPLGGRGAKECCIDSLAQSFAALDEASDRERAALALDAAVARLYDRERGVVKLFTPPFAGRGQDPGYLGGYHPGLRENGGQYTHAGVWLALACLRTGRTETGWELLRAMLPERHPTEVYRAESYVLAADVSDRGRGGWSWNTGAAGWYRRTAVEELLGLRMEDGRLLLRPRLPEDWPGWTGQWRAPNGAEYEIEVRRGETAGSYLDGAPITGGVDWKQDTGRHRLEVVLSSCAGQEKDV